MYTPKPRYNTSSYTSRYGTLQVFFGKDSSSATFADHECPNTTTVFDALLINPMLEVLPTTFALYGCGPVRM